ncbi:hypothetical protein N802_01115 [Knoellia sinensis KCTC 19936]|uniref:Uncharacterized protein n=1 Tax=Knoellia sinensis KCTC 19936 TaxID=1385520 RepID=A0A0A0JCC8_9MICO|nr:hypothetical protein N802_01115 [Knoellia sinensis KCTC 19936]
MGICARAIQRTSPVLSRGQLESDVIVRAIGSDVHADVGALRTAGRE